MIFIQILVLVAGFVALVKGADFFVDGSSALARRFHVPGLIIGLTVVALGTSLPELAVSTSAAMAGSNEIAISNVVGSNLFNILVVLGSCAVVCTVPVDRKVVRRDMPMVFLSTIIVLAAVGAGVIAHGLRPLQMDRIVGTVFRFVGIALLVIFAAYMIFLVRDAKKNPLPEEPGETMWPGWKCVLFIVIGAVMIILGGKAVVWAAQGIAQAAGMSETLIGLTVVAFGTSLPELVTSIVAARKGEVGLAAGNVIGSNILNMMLILGVSSSIHPVAVNLASFFDLLILLGVIVMTTIIMKVSGNVRRRAGALMLAIYAAVVVFAIVR
ncbi:MAG: calcium/sodium antiporter [Lachnospiraceae bacterium]|nr:calcium/sodium antiporter [Lachnospiraceae bacterium]